MMRRAGISRGQGIQPSQLCRRGHWVKLRSKDYVEKHALIPLAINSAFLTVLTEYRYEKAALIDKAALNPVFSAISRQE